MIRACRWDCAVRRPATIRTSPASWSRPASTPSRSHRTSSWRRSNAWPRLSATAGNRREATDDADPAVRDLGARAGRAGLSPPERCDMPLDVPYQGPLEDLLDDLDVSLDEGLTEREAGRRHERHGANRLRRYRARPAWRILTDQVASLVVLLLLAATAIAALFGRTLEAAAIGAALVVNTIVGFFMEWRATRSMESLQQMGRVEARVRRDGGRRASPPLDWCPVTSACSNPGTWCPPTSGWWKPTGCAATRPPSPANPNPWARTRKRPTSRISRSVTAATWRGRARRSSTAPGSVWSRPSARTPNSGAFRNWWKPRSRKPRRSRNGWSNSAGDSSGSRWRSPPPPPLPVSRRARKWP